jgi:hypothetical protein
LEQIRERKLAQLRELGIPEKYQAELARKPLETTKFSH